MRLRYGIFEAHYPNDQLPLGITKTKANARQLKLFFPGAIGPTGANNGELGLNVNCMICHSRWLPGKEGPQVAEGIGNPFLDFQRLNDDISRTVDSPRGLLLKRNPYRNSYVSAAAAMAELVTHVRNDDDSFSQIRLNARMVRVWPRQSRPHVRRRPHQTSKTKPDSVFV